MTESIEGMKVGPGSLSVNSMFVTNILSDHLTDCVSCRSNICKYTIITYRKNGQNYENEIKVAINWTYPLMLLQNQTGGFSLKISSNQMLNVRRNPSHKRQMQTFYTNSLLNDSESNSTATREYFKREGAPRSPINKHPSCFYYALILMLFPPVAKAVGGIFEDLLGNRCLDQRQTKQVQAKKEINLTLDPKLSPGLL